MLQKRLIDLEGIEPIATGTYRSVYVMPQHSDQVIKVMRTGAHEKPGRPIRNYLKSRSEIMRHRFMFREYDSFLRLKLKQRRLGGALPVTELFGVFQTTKGVGMVTERVLGENGQNAVTLGGLVKTGAFDSSHLAYLNTFIQEVYRWQALANDTNPENILLDESGDTPRFVLVDGFGDANAIPLKSWSKVAWARGLNRRFRQLGESLGMTWDPVRCRIVTR